MKVFAILAACFFFFIPIVHAQQTSAPQLSVSPSLVRLNLDTDKPQVVLTYKNLTKTAMELSFTAQDFKELEEGYQLSYLQPKDVNNYKYGLSSWIQFSSKTFLLDPGESAMLTVYIEKDKLSPGGHYATVFAHINPENTNQQVTVKGVLGSLLFVRTSTGPEDESAQLPTFDLVRNFLDFPDSIYFRFDNTGDVDLVPYGLVQVTDSGNHLIAKGIVNEDSAPTLPASVRRYYVPLRNLQLFILPGFYHATVQLHFGDSNKKLSKTFTFFTQGSTPFIPLSIVLLLAIFGVFMWKKHLKK